MNPISYERFEIWSKYFHIGGNFSYKNQINHEGEGIINSLLVPSNPRPATYLHQLLGLHYFWFWEKIVLSKIRVNQVS